MKLTSMLLSFILAGSMAQQELPKKRDLPIQDDAQSEGSKTKAFKMARSLFDIYIGLVIMDGAQYELEDGWFDFSKFELAGVSLVAHGAQGLYKQLKDQDFKALYAALLAKITTQQTPPPAA